MKFTSLNHDTIYNNNSAYNDGDGAVAQSKARRSRRSPRGKGKTLHGDGKPVAEPEVPVARPDSYYDGEGRTRNAGMETSAAASNNNTFRYQGSTQSPYSGRNTLTYEPVSNGAMRRKSNSGRHSGGEFVEGSSAPPGGKQQSRQVYLKASAPEFRPGGASASITRSPANEEDSPAHAHELPSRPTPSRTLNSNDNRTTAPSSSGVAPKSGGMDRSTASASFQPQPQHVTYVNYPSSVGTRAVASGPTYTTYAPAPVMAMGGSGVATSQPIYTTYVENHVNGGAGGVNGNMNSNGGGNNAMMAHAGPSPSNAAMPSYHISAAPPGFGYISAAPPQHAMAAPIVYLNNGGGGGGGRPNINMLMTASSATPLSSLPPPPGLTWYSPDPSLYINAPSAENIGYYESPGGPVMPGGGSGVGGGLQTNQASADNSGMMLDANAKTFQPVSLPGGLVLRSRSRALKDRSDALLAPPIPEH
eukprot:gene1825-2142_t